VGEKTENEAGGKGESAEDYTPIEIPGVVSDLSSPFSELEGEQAQQLLEGLFDAEMSDEDVTGIRDDIAAEVKLLNEQRQKPENRGEAAGMVDRMEELLEYLDVVEAEMGKRQEAANELDQRAEQIASRFADGEGEGDDAAGDGGDGEDEEGSGEGDDAGAAEGAEADGDEDEDGEDGDGGSAADSAPQAAARPSGTGLARQMATRSKTRKGRSRVASAAAQTVEEAKAGGDGELDLSDPNALAESLLGKHWSGDAIMVATAEAKSSKVPDLETGETLASLTDLGEVFWAKRATMRVGRGVKDDRVTLAQATIEWGEDRKLGEDAFKNFGVFRSLRSDVDVIVASGGSCALATPRYDIFRLDERHVGFYVADAVGHGVAAAVPGRPPRDLLQGGGALHRHPVPVAGRGV